MTYPVVFRSDVTAYINGRGGGHMSGLDLKVSYRDSPGDDWVEQIDETLDVVLADWRAKDLSKFNSDQKRDELEGRLSVSLYEGLAELPAKVLTDKDFWRYAACYLYEFVLWRQTTKKVTAQLPYFGAASNGLGRECVPHRMFDRAYIAQAGGLAAKATDKFEMAKFGAADVWKSHILRVANGAAPIVVHELLTDVKGGMLKTELVRPFVKNLRRVRANVLFEILDPLQARDLIDRERTRTVANLDALDEADSAH
jgi:hypothetical protein